MYRFRGRNSIRGKFHWLEWASNALIATLHRCRVLSVYPRLFELSVDEEKGSLRHRHTRVGRVVKAKSKMIVYFRIVAVV